MMSSQRQQQFLGIQLWMEEDVYRYICWFRSNSEQYTSMTCQCYSASITGYGQRRRVEVYPLEPRLLRDVPFLFQTIRDDEAPWATICPPSSRMTSYARPVVVNEQGHSLITDFGILLDIAPQIRMIL